MKADEEHRVPLSDQAMKVLETVQGLGPDLVFPAGKRGNDGTEKECSDGAVRARMTRMGREDVTAHGFRSSFRSSARERHHEAHEVPEMCLAHRIGDAVSQACARSDLLDRRRPVMDTCGRFEAAGQGARVVELHGRGGPNVTIDARGTGRDTPDEVHGAIARRFGAYDDIRDVIVKRNPSPPGEIVRQHEIDFIRDDTSQASADMIFTSLFGEVRVDSLLGRFAAGDIRVNTWVWEAIWALALFDLAKAHASSSPPGIREAMDVSACAGAQVARMELNGVMGAANVKDGWNRGTDDSEERIACRERDVFTCDRDAEFARLDVGSRRERAKRIAQALLDERPDLPRCGSE